MVPGNMEGLMAATNRVEKLEAALREIRVLALRNYEGPGLTEAQRVAICEIAKAALAKAEA